jgi:hypothetical protein
MHPSTILPVSPVAKQTEWWTDARERKFPKRSKIQKMLKGTHVAEILQP